MGSGRNATGPKWLSLGVLDGVDLGLQHGAFRMFALYQYLALHHAEHCDFVVKADGDAFLNVPAILRRLRCFDPADPLYLGRVTCAANTVYV